MNVFIEYQYQSSFRQSMTAARKMNGRFFRSTRKSDTLAALMDCRIHAWDGRVSPPIQVIIRKPESPSIHPIFGASAYAA